MKLFIPPLQTKLVLKNSCVLTLHAEYRNEKYIHYVIAGSGRKYGTIRQVFAPGTVLRVERIYIRRNQADFDSVTFTRWDGDKILGRFWVKLDEANQIDCEVVQ